MPGESAGPPSVDSLPGHLRDTLTEAASSLPVSEIATVVRGLGLAMSVADAWWLAKELEKYPRGTDGPRPSKKFARKMLLKLLLSPTTSSLLVSFMLIRAFTRCLCMHIQIMRAFMKGEWEPLLRSLPKAKFKDRLTSFKEDDATG